MKNTHVDQIPDMQAYVQLFLSHLMASDRGLLKTLGLVPLLPDELESMRQKLTPDALNG